MNTTLEISLQELHSARRQTKADDELSRQIAVLESALNDLNLRVCAWIEETVIRDVEVISDDDIKYLSEVHYTRRLGYGEHQGEWASFPRSIYD